jgi:hypothetical protein
MISEIRPVETGLKRLGCGAFADPSVTVESLMG